MECEWKGVGLAFLQPFLPGRRGGQRMRWLDSVTNPTDMNFSNLWEIVEDRGNWRATIHGNTKSQTRLSKWTTTTEAVWDVQSAWPQPCAQAQGTETREDTPNPGLASKTHTKTKKNTASRHFPGVQWLRISLPMQGTQVRSLVRESKVPHTTTRENPERGNKEPEGCN